MLEQGEIRVGPGHDERGITRMGFFGAAIFVVIAARLVWLQVVEGEELAEAAESQRTNAVTLHAKRGTIYDRNGNALAVSVDCQTVYANPSAVDDPSGVASALAEVLGGSSSDYLDKLLEDTTFVYIEQRVDEDVAEDLEALLDERGLSGIYFLDDTKRVYPYGSTGAQVLGYVGTEGTGLSGLEYYYESILAGTDGEMIMETGLYGTPIAGGVYEVTEAQDGADIVIGLDINLQATVEELVLAGEETYEATSGMALVLDPKTGQIIAACSTPLADFDDISDLTALNLRMVTDSYEPGSLFKVVTTSIGFELGIFEPDTTYTIPVTIDVGEYTVADDDLRDYTMSMTVREMLRRSSNVAMAVLVRDVIGSEAFAEGVDALGIGHTTGIDFPGEAEGIVYSTDYEYYDAQACFMGFGQGVAVPMVQLIRVVQTFANGGVALTPHFLVSRDGEEVDWGEGERILSEEACEMEIDCMRAVIESGTGTNGQVEGYDVVGKTGTGEQSSTGEGYDDYGYTASLCGFANASDPEVLVYAGLNGVAYVAASSTAKVFSQIMTEAVQVLGIQPVETDDEDED